MTNGTIKFFGIVCIGSALAGCSPFIDSRREAGQVQPVGQSAPNRPAICYHPLWTDLDSLQDLADTTCAPKKAVFTDKKYFNCRLFTPNTAFYECK